MKKEFRPYLEQIESGTCPICLNRQTSTNHSVSSHSPLKKQVSHGEGSYYSSVQSCQECATTYREDASEVVTMLQDLCDKASKVLLLDEIKEEERINGILLNHEDTAETAAERLCKLATSGIYYHTFELRFVCFSNYDDHLVAELKSGAVFVLENIEYDLYSMYDNQYNNAYTRESKDVYKIRPDPDIVSGVSRSTLMANAI